MYLPEELKASLRGLVRINEVVGVGKKGYSGSYIITSVDPESVVHAGFWNNLQHYAKETGAEILLQPLKPHRPPLERNDDDFPTCYKSFEVDGHGLLLRRKHLNKKVVVSNYTILPQQVIPTTGLERFTQSDVTTIFASPKQHLKVIPNSNVKLPKILTTTGALTQPKYRDNRIGQIARMDHEIGAAIVEVVDDQLYHLRHIQAMNDGTFVDLGARYEGGKKGKAVLEALVIGDTHVGDTDPDVRTATYNMIEELEPRRIVLHDFFNGHSVNHHEWEKSATRAQDFRAQRTSLEEELRACAVELRNYVEAVPASVQIYLVDCNHHDFLATYLEAQKHGKDRENAYIGSKLFCDVVDGKNAVEEGIKMFYHPPKNVHFLNRDQDLKVRGWQLGAHGDKGSNGAKGSVRSRESAYGKSITGHTHTPEKFRNTVIVGTSTYLNLRYNKGPSSWMNTHGLLYDTGKVQLVNIINGEWRREDD